MGLQPGDQSTWEGLCARPIVEQAQFTGKEYWVFQKAEMGWVKEEGFSLNLKEAFTNC